MFWKAFQNKVSERRSGKLFRIRFRHNVLESFSEQGFGKMFRRIIQYNKKLTCYDKPSQNSDSEIYFENLFRITFRKTFWKVFQDTGFGFVLESGLGLRLGLGWA